MSSKTIVVDLSKPNQLSTSSSNSNEPSSEDITSFPDTLGQFQLFERLGFGASGSVFRAICESDQRVYAIKKIPQYSFKGNNQESMIMNEIGLLEEARNPGITKCFGFYVQADIFHVILEFVDGGTLGQRLDKGPFSEDETRTHILDIARVLEHLHQKNIIHRDIKLGNVLVTSDDQIKLADFGLAIKVTSGSTSGSCGTSYAQAPEIIRREDYNKSIDWWALGVMMYEMVTGQKPFNKIGSTTLAQSIQFGKLKFPATISTECSEVISRLLEKRVEDRLNSLEMIMAMSFFNMHREKEDSKG